MSTAVWKFAIPVEDEFIITMPVGAEVLRVAEQRGAAWMWARVSLDAPPVERTFYVRGTGHGVEADLRYVGSFMLGAGVYVGHVFER